MRCPRPWRGRKSRVVSFRRPRTMVSLGGPKGVSTRAGSTSVSPGMSYRPLPPMIARTLPGDGVEVMSSSSPRSLAELSHAQKRLREGGPPRPPRTFGDHDRAKLVESALQVLVHDEVVEEG